MSDRAGTIITGGMGLILLDTCVLVDMCLVGRPRHQRALALKTKLDAEKTIPRMLAHAFFELRHAMSSELARDGKILKGFELRFDRCVSIDEGFITTYMDPSLPTLRAGDLIFLAYAKREKLPLITEDSELLKVGRKSGVATYSIDEYMARSTVSP